MIIPAKPKKGNTVKEDSPKRLRVAAYCRVSTDTDEQATSYEAQVTHYTEYISKNPEWVLAGIFADDGISGTNTKKRTEFNNLIEKCMAGDVDMVITKSISRFARNTLDCLNYIRQLKEKNIPVFFEKENINTMDAKGEVLLTIMASLAQQESQSLSQNVKLGLQYRYQQGLVQVNHNYFLGYTKDDSGKLIIDLEQAETVKRIYREYLSGYSMDKIAAGLEKDGILTGGGNKKWWTSTIKKILTNEKYIGDALLQKTYTTDFLSKTRVKNNGIVPQYYVESNHEAIIPKDLFTMVREEMSRRRVKHRSPNGKTHSFSSNYCFSNIVFCSHCGEVFCRVHWYRKEQKRTMWRCGSRLDKDGIFCNARSLVEDDLNAMVLKALNTLLGSKNKYLDILQKNITAIVANTSTPNIESIDNELIELQQELLKRANDRKQYDDIADKIFHLREIKAQAEEEGSKTNTNIQRLTELCDFIKCHPQELTEVDDQLFRRLLKSITVYDDYIHVELKSGISIDVNG